MRLLEGSGRHRRETQSGKRLFIAVSAGTALSALITSGIAQIPEDAPEKLSDFAFDKLVGNCPQVSKAASLAVREALSSEPYHYSADQIENLAHSLGVEIISREEVNKTELKIAHSTTQDQALATLNEYTGTNFGFSVITAQKLGEDGLKFTKYPNRQLDEVKDDLMNYVGTLADIPKDLLKKADISRVVLVGELDDSNLDIDPAGLARDNAIYFEPDADDKLIYHEFSHKFDEAFCGSELAADNDKIFAGLQPKWLTNSERDRIWKEQDHQKAESTTARTYGIRNDSEDKAVLSEEIFDGDFTGNEDVMRKKLLIASRYEEMAPGSMTLVAGTSVKR